VVRGFLSSSYHPGQWLLSGSQATPERGRVQDSRSEALAISIPKSETAVMFVPEFE